LPFPCPTWATYWEAIMTVTAQDTMAQLDRLSDRISTHTRWVAGVILALIWGLIVTPPATIKLPFAALVWVGLLSVSALFVDFLQYACGYKATRQLHRIILDAPSQSVAGYNTDDPWYRAREKCFTLKQILIIVTFLALVATLLTGLLTSP
jgi:hypothetical protein